MVDLTDVLPPLREPLFCGPGPSLANFPALAWVRRAQGDAWRGAHLPEHALVSLLHLLGRIVARLEEGRDRGRGSDGDGDGPA